MRLINYEINLSLTWPRDCVFSSVLKATAFTVTDTNLYLSIVSLSTQDNVKLLRQLKSGFKRTINWNNYQLKVSIKKRNQYLDYLIDPSFQGVNILFVLSFQVNTYRIRHTRYFLPKVEIKGYNIMIDGQNISDQPVKNDMRT